MNEIIIETEARPDYYHGQLLEEADFKAEQDFHVDARLRHNREVHGWGIVSGCTVERKSSGSVLLNAGVAISPDGHEIILPNAQEIDLKTFKARDRVRIAFVYKEVESKREQNRREFTTVVSVTEVNENPPSAVTVALVELDEKGQVLEPIDYSETRFTRHRPRTGWLRLPFRPLRLANKPEGEDQVPEGFRVGTTEARSPSPDEPGAKDGGAAGTMAIPIPPGARKVLRFRIAGMVNKGKIDFSLVVGGWDPNNSEHVCKNILDEKISAEPYAETFTNIKDADLDPEWHTLSLWLRGHKKTSVSLVAIEFAYWD